MSFTLHNLTPQKEKALTGYFRSNPNITYVAKTMGKWDFMINIAAKDLQSFDVIVHTIRVKFSDIIKEYETSSIIQEHKYDHMVDLI